MSLNMNLSKNLKAIKQSRALSIADFASELCIARSSLQNILTGECNPRMDTVNQIASSLNTDPMTLLQDQYSSEQYSIAIHILDSLESFQRLSEHDRHMVAELFNQLILLLDKGSC